MKLLNRLERKLAPLAITNLTIYIIFLQSLAWLLSLARSDFRMKLVLNRELVLHGQYWRLISFVILPSVTDALWLFFGLWLFYIMGTALENQWGAFRYNFYLFIGYLATVASVMLIPGAIATNVYLMASVLLAFAELYPDFTILLYFIFPVKVKYLGWLVWIGYLVGFLGGDWGMRAQILAASANFVLFFHADIWQNVRRISRKIKQGPVTTPLAPGEAFHTCVVCGVNDITNRTMEFRYCPLCKGTPCYCIDHINAHTHQ